MAKLAAGRRAELRDSAFAYIDGRGQRRLPIHDEPHVRNALARFNQVIFEDEAARDRARTRLLRAARRYGIVPVGFMEGQLRSQGPRGLPTGSVTFLMTDVVDSTGLIGRLGDGYIKLLADLRRLIRAAVRRAGGREVDARADEYFAVFRHAPAAMTAALAIQVAVGEHAWPGDAVVRLRAGIHSGRPTLTESGYVGLSVHAVARICAAAAGGQVVASRAAVKAVGEAPIGVTLSDLGLHRLRGLPESELLFEVRAAARRSDVPPEARGMAEPTTFRGLQVIGFGHPGSDLRRELVDLVLAGVKTATAGLLVELELYGETMPVPGMREVVIDADGRFVAEIETTECRVLRRADVDDEFARDEGEGFADAAAWRTAHDRFWGRYIDEIRERLGDPDWSLTDDTQIVCQRFRLAEVYPEPIPSSV